MGTTFRHANCVSVANLDYFIKLVCRHNVDEDHPKTRTIEGVKNMVTICYFHFWDLILRVVWWGVLFGPTKAISPPFA